MVEILPYRTYASSFIFDITLIHFCIYPEKILMNMVFNRRNMSGSPAETLLRSRTNFANRCFINYGVWYLICRSIFFYICYALCLSELSCKEVAVIMTVRKLEDNHESLICGSRRRSISFVPFQANLWICLAMMMHIDVERWFPCRIAFNGFALVHQLENFILLRMMQILEPGSYRCKILLLVICLFSNVWFCQVDLVSHIIGIVACQFTFQSNRKLAII